MATKQHRESLSYITCRFCGQTFLPDKDIESQEERLEAGTLKCDCEEAKTYQSKIKAAADKQKNLKTIKDYIEDFKAYCKSRGFSLTEEIVTSILLLAELVIDDQIASGTLNFSEIKAKISKSKGNIVFVFSYSDNMRIEV